MMAGLTDVVLPVDSLSKLKMEGTSEQGIAPSAGGGAAPKGGMSTSPQGKGVGLFALETMAGEEVDSKIKDPKVTFPLCQFMQCLSILWIAGW